MKRSGYPEALKPGTEAYYLHGLHLAKVREQLGGVTAYKSAMFIDSISGLRALGWPADRILMAVEAEFNQPDTPKQEPGVAAEQEKPKT